MKEKNTENQKIHRTGISQKSRPYPPTSLAEALGLATVIEKLGERQVAEPSLLKALNLSHRATTSFWRKTSAAKQFGLIAIEKKNYSLTDRARQILRPINKASKEKLLVEAFLSPELYKNFYEVFRGKKIPDIDTIANIFNHKFSIITNASKDAASAFIESAKFAGLLSEDDILCTKDLVIDSLHDFFASAPTSGIPTIDAKKAPSPDKDYFTTTIEISKGLVTITVPKGGITKEDKERLLKTLDASLIVKE